MMWLRSAFFLLIMIVSTPLLASWAMLHFPFNPQLRRQGVDPWVNMTSWLIEHLLGINYRVIGKENIPTSAAVILSKHQSAWETIVLQKIFPRTIFVWKKEILWLPFFGWALAVHPSIAINRAYGFAALSELAQKGKLRLQQGFSVVIFPEGTRTLSGSQRNFKPGGAHLAVSSCVQVVAVAHNSGNFWPRQAFLKRPGTVTVKISPPIQPKGLSVAELNRHAETWINEAMQEINSLPTGWDKV